MRRLIERGVTGLGFGSGVAREDVPAELVEAAAELGLPLIDVPRPTPFISVGEEVSRLLAKEEYEGLTRAFDAQRRLTRAALRGAEAVVDRLASELGGWLLLLAVDGTLRYAAPAGAASHAPALEAEARRLRDSRQRASASLPTGEEHISLQPLGVGGRTRGFLALGTGHRLGSEERTLVNAAISLLSLELERSAPARGEGLQEGLLEALIGGAVALESEQAGRLRAALPAEPVLLAITDAWETSRRCGTRTWTAASPPRPASTSSCWAVGAPTRARRSPGSPGGPVGASEPGGYGDLPAARAQAERALEAARGGAGAAGPLRRPAQGIPRSDR